ncbi:MAG: amidohydrolase family protein [Nitrospinota bacterium]
MAIDIHCHFFPKGYLELIEREGRPFNLTLCRDQEGRLRCNIKGRLHPPLEPFSEPDLRLKAMEAKGVRTEVISLSSWPNVYWADPCLGRDLSRAVNEGYRDLAQAYPGRFVGMASVPLQDVRAAIEEAERAVGELGLKGVLAGTNINGRYLDHPDFLPFLEAVEALGVPLLIHPIPHAARELMEEYFLFNLLGYPLESTLALSRLIFSGRLERFPGLRFILVHGGGIFPYLRGRLERGYKVVEECRSRGSRPPGEYIERFNFDTVVFRPDILRFLVEAVGRERVLLGSDFPYDSQDPDPLKTLEGAELSEEDRRLISEENARLLLGL